MFDAVHTRSVAHPASYYMYTVAFSAGINQPEGEDNHSEASIADIKIEWSYTSISRHEQFYLDFTSRYGLKSAVL